MPQSDEAAAWFAAVYSAVQEVPLGKVTTYGHIARLLGYPERPRQVGICLKHLPGDTSQRYHSANVPWQRVINARGTITPRGQQGAQRQAQALRNEGIDVGRSDMGEYTVSLEEYGWFPDGLADDD